MDELLAALKSVRAQLVGTSGPHSMPPQYDTFIGPRPSSPGVAAAQNTPSSLQTPAANLSAVPTPSSPIPLHARPTQPPPPPSESSAAHPSFAPAPKRGIGMAVAVSVAAIAIAVAVVAVLKKSERPPDPAPYVAAPIAAPVQVQPAPPPQVQPGALPPAAVPADPPSNVPTALTGTTLVRVVSTPSGAEVRDVDERILGNTPFEMRVPSNKPLQLTLRAEGYKPLVLKAAKVIGERLDLPATLKPDPKVNIKADPLLGSKHTAGYKDDPY